MKESDRTRLTQTVNSIVCLRYRGLRPLAVLLSLISVVMGLSLLFDDDLRGTAAQHGPNNQEKLIAPEVNLPRLFSFGHAFAKSSTSEDRVWQNLKKAVAVEYVGKVPGFNWLTQVNLRLPDGLAGTQVC